MVQDSTANQMMKAIIVKDDKSLSWEEVVKPSPKAKEVLIKVVAAGLNRADILQRRGMYPPPEGAPDIMGLEVSGYVEAVGEGVDDWQLGQEVCALLPAGGYAEYAIAHHGSVMPVPEGVSLQEAALLPEAVLTVWANVYDIAVLHPGETLFIQGGASGIGTTAIQMAKAMGANVYVTAGSDEKCKACIELGADGAFNYKTTDFEEELKAVGGADVILDMVGGDYLPKHINALNFGGRLVHIAVQGGLKGEVNILKVMMKQLNITGSTLRGRNDVAKMHLANMAVEEVWPWVASGQVRPIVDSSFAMQKAEKAHDRMTSGEHIGKIMLTL
ncbi:NAD(P)H-quinone oxidoreductase [Hirschia baltica]|uniref:NAD(P)H quinone oxidoreductase, PIG3 family n=1 Tax=Hirschia baltica (strain ATCC 49814 / DSM 5838 / IFAM 1418) TaxID=582402 RepID=C6XRM6_HIRBI|nr:NAD(P)H-quinone oxidoreductase [Hirschia baltica]ACT60636.1 NAD(P)H quinone oxidoreductase, PIG3 family [Hirschia baltica ATCC 49814]